MAPESTLGALGPRVRAHEAVHRAQHAQWGLRTVGTRGELEREAWRGERELLAGRPFTPTLAAAPGTALAWCPEGTCCDDDAEGECPTEPTSTDLPEEPMECSTDEEASPPDAGVLSLPRHERALSGIRPYLLVDTGAIPVLGRVLLDHVVQAGPYTVAVHTDGEPPRALYAIAWRREREENEWVIGPDAFEEFLGNAELYAGAANQLLPGSPLVPTSMRDRPDPSEGSWHTGGTAGSGLVSGWDAHVRLSSYVAPARTMAADILRRVDRGELDHLAARQMAVEGRNDLLGATRERLSPGGRAFSRALKEEGRSMGALTSTYVGRVVEASPELLERYGLTGVGRGTPAWESGMSRALAELGETEAISREIIRASGRNSRAVTGVARVSRVLGPAGVALGLGVSAYEIVNAPEGEALHVAAREGGGFAGGTLGAMAGGMVGGWVASLACGPGAPVCALIVSVVCVGGAAYAGGRLGEQGGEGLYGALQGLPMLMPAHGLAAGGGFAGLMDRDRRRFEELTAPLDVRALREVYDITGQLRELEARIPLQTDPDRLRELQRARLLLMQRREELLELVEALRTDARR
ncbi:MAG TPA: hypothetical protein PKA64_12025 [Myxococcota bacterium]|nr:hypothetical protein [Myxococcota bacterium]